MKRIHRSASPLFGVILLPVLVLAGQSSAPVTLRMKYRMGETNKYQTNANIDVNGGMKFDVSAVQIHKVQKTFTDGGADVEITTTEARNNGQPTGATPPIIMSYDSRGMIRGMRGAIAGGDMMGGMFNTGAMQMQGAFLPEKPVKSGEKWAQTFKMTGISSGAKASSEFLKVERINRYLTAKIRTKITAPMTLMLDSAVQPTTDPKKAAMKGVGTLSMTVDTNFAIADGKMIRTAGSGLINMTMKPTNAPIQPPKKGPAPKTTKVPPKSKPATEAANGLKINLKMQMGSNLIE